MVGAYWTIDDLRVDVSALIDSASYQRADFYRSFTKTLKELFSDLMVVKGDDTPRHVDIIYANPERAVAKINESQNTILPILSIQSDGIELDNTRRKPMEALVEKKFWSKDKQRAIRFLAPAPVAADLVYSINIWGKYVEEVNQLTEQLMLMFRPNLSVEIREGESSQAYIREVSDTSQFTAGDRQDRLIKRVVKFHVQSYIPGKVFRFTNTGEIETFNYDMFLQIVDSEGLTPVESYKLPPTGASSGNRGINITTSTS